MRLNEFVRKTALEYVAASLSVFPIKSDGSKRPPPIPWKPYQSRLASAYEVAQMFRNDVGIAILGGKVSGGLEMLDFDRAWIFEPWGKLIEERVPGLLTRLPQVKTPKGGRHVYYRCREIQGNQKLAQESPEIDPATKEPKPNTLIETRGEGGYVIAPGSPLGCHPSGKPYEHVAGPPLTRIPEITPEERKVLFDAARSFNKWTPTNVRTLRPSGKIPPPEGILRPGDDFMARASWEEILGAHGWKPVREMGNEVHWRRPGKQDPGISATTGHCGDYLYVFSSNAAPLQANHPYDKFAAYADLNHGGDFTAAAKDLSSRGYGTDGNNPAEIAKREKEIESFGTEPGKAANKVDIPESARANENKGDGEADQKPPKKYKKRDESHKGNAGKYFEGKDFLPARLTDEIRKDFRLIASPISKHEGMGTTLFVYSDGVFNSDGAAIIREEIDYRLGEESKPQRIQTVIDLLRERCKVKYERLNKDAKDLINVENGMLDWRTGEVKPHDPSYLSTIRINARWNPNAECPAVDKFMDEVFPPDALLLAEEVMGYFVTPSTKYQKSFVVVGEGSNGKSKFFDMVKGFIGDENVTSISLHEIEEGRFSKANLFGRLLNIDSETANKIIKSTSQFKAIVGGDTIQAEHKGKDPFYFTPFVRLLFSANRFPRAQDTTKAYFRRLVFIPFEREFIEGVNADPDLSEKLVTGKARSRVLSRAINGLRRLSKNTAFTNPASSKNFMEDYRKECNSAYEFAKTFCAMSDDSHIKKSEMYEKYKDWCSWSTMKPFSEKEFNRILVTAAGMAEGRERMANGSVRVWKGVRWGDQEPELRDVNKWNPRSFNEPKSDAYESDF